MTWKNTLRKAPFNIGEVQSKRIEETNAKKKQLLDLFPRVLETHLDPYLQEEIRNKPNKDAYYIYVAEVANQIKHLENNGIKTSEIIQLLKDAYNAKDVAINSDGTIKFGGMTTP